MIPGTIVGKWNPARIPPVVTDWATRRATVIQENLFIQQILPHTPPIDELLEAKECPPFNEANLGIRLSIMEAVKITHIIGQGHTKLLLRVV